VRQLAVVGKQQQALRIDIEPPGREQIEAGKFIREQFKSRLQFIVKGSRDDARRLIHHQIDKFPVMELLTPDLYYAVHGINLYGCVPDRFSVQTDLAVFRQFFDFASAAESEIGQQLIQTLGVLHQLSLLQPFG
jgi:hypothetical protein